MDLVGFAKALALETKEQVRIYLAKAVAGITAKLEVLTARVDVLERRGAPGENGDSGRDEPSRLATLEATVAALTDTVATLQKAQLKYQGPWLEGKAYREGDLVSFRGSGWIAAAPTSERPGDGPTSWRLFVKAGRDGRDAR